MSKKTYQLEYICLQMGITEGDLALWIEHEIIHPYDLENMLFDEEDFRRISFICDIQDRCAPNIESLQVIIHLLDQIQYLQKNSSS